MDVQKRVTTKSIESELLLLCTPLRLAEDRMTSISALLGRVPDWDSFFEISGRNGLLPLVSWNLLRSFRGEFPAEIEKRLDEFLHSHTRRNLILTRNLIEIVDNLENAGISVLPFKGTTLAQRAYGNLALRQYVDLDILVQPKHFNEAMDLLISKGYTPEGNEGWTERRTPGFSRRKDIVLSDLTRSIHVELHWKLSGSHFGLPIEIRELWERLEKIDVGGACLNTLSFQDLYVYLSLHGSRHGWGKLAWLCDLRELIETQEASGQPVDWSEIRDKARKHGCEKVVELSVYLLDSILGYRIPYPGFDQIEKDESFKRIAETVRNKTLTSSQESSEIGDWYFYHLSLKERKIDRLRVHAYYLVWYFRLVFTPNALDKAIFPLPGIFYPLYFILRPVRLLFGYFVSPDNDKTG